MLFKVVVIGLGILFYYYQEFKRWRPNLRPLFEEVNEAVEKVNEAVEKEDPQK